MSFQRGDWVRYSARDLGPRFTDGSAQGLVDGRAYQVVRAHMTPEGPLAGRQLVSVLAGGRVVTVIDLRLDMIQANISTANGISVGDTVICNRDFGDRRDPHLGTYYRVAKFSLGGLAHDTIFLWPEGLDDGWAVENFTKVTLPKTVVGTQVDWEASYRTCEKDRDGLRLRLVEALARERALLKEVAHLKETKHVNPGYLRELETFRTAILGAVPRKEGEERDETVRRVVAEHKTMKRQLELAESYNFDRKGLSDSEAVRDLYNYILVALDKKPLSLYAWTVQRAKALLSKTLSRDFWQAPVFDDDAYRYTLLCQRPQPLNYIPITFIVTDPKPSHQSDAYSPTGCAASCSHPDCKKDRK